MDEWYSVTEIEKKTGIADSTVRRYIRNHGHHLQIKKRGKSYLIAEDSIPTIKKIRELYDKGKQSEDVNDSLRKMNIPTVITVTDKDDSVTVDVSEVLIQLQKDMNDQKEFNKALLEHIKKQQEYIDNKLEERDQRLIAAIRESQETRREIAAEKEEKKSWISRLFNK